MTVDNEKKHHAMHKISRIELKCATMTVEKESQVYEMHKKAGWSSDGQYLLLRKKARSVQHKKKREEWSSDAQY